MRTNPTSMGLFYLLMGSLFIYLAANSAKNGLFTLPTIIIMLIATFDLGVAIRMFALSFKLKKMKEKEK
ncbi:DUF4305 domain-containing protein [Metabacillus fastidiosus]|uniref:DUF4305 domain-containing protein n=1 Tax=Metabacillus fastidiosus TaxID=1458 RepID=A0ABU6P543_9BACI|nr:DUF4305 domain-containing protein [Metabacillus fastidiosus]MEC2075152.1 DUF4305 domain-containing protein [Metabacillus fastidiosus]MED4404248.1 DUF4305 domain-containing protein [Metabacillus fastidiosus]MED4455868.1 DUF4305 domain-containing protein [Metabacillus fastidiosus]MED4464661.1 DUF4305 domain-containing protein [Metabacillus fastidiosus]MED4534877.1 DUF4305 domain-containing protein [Metabacillus fastidiosus]